MLREWSTSDLTKDLAAKLRLDQFLVVAEAVLCPRTLQRADLLAMRRKLADGPMLIMEIKTSRADLLGDLRREKWRGYLDHGAVCFAFPASLADPKEIPTEAGVICRIAQGWQWRRAPRWASAPKPTSYLYRRMALTASDQSAAKVRAELEPRAADLWKAARAARQTNGRRLAQIAQDFDTWAAIVDEQKAKYDRLYSIKARLEQEINDLAGQKRRLEKAA